MRKSKNCIGFWVITGQFVMGKFIRHVDKNVSQLMLESGEIIPIWRKSSRVY